MNGLLKDELPPSCRITELREQATGAVVRVCGLVEERRPDGETFEALLRDETGECWVRLEIRGQPERRQWANRLFDGFVLDLIGRLAAPSPSSGLPLLELPDLESVVDVQRFLRPGHDLALFHGEEVVLTGDLVRIGWLTARGEALLLLAEGETRAVSPQKAAWVVFRYLDDPELLEFARQIDHKGTLALRGHVERLVVAPNEPIYPPAWALFRGFHPSGGLEVLRLNRAEDRLLAEEGIPLPYVPVRCELGRSLGCQIQCCAQQVRLSEEEVAHGLEATEIPGGIFYLRREEDGYCYALDRQSGLCRVYEIRPQTCRTFTCAHDPAILERMARHGPLDELPLFHP